MHVVVDGYNVMHALPVGQEWPGKSFQDRRRSFLDRLAAYGAHRSHRFTVVFDGTRGGEAMGGAETWRGIDVRYSPRGVEADDVLLEVVERAPRAADLLLVTSDKSVADRARALGASVARADELVGKLRQAGGLPQRTGPAAFEESVKGMLPPAPRSRSAARSRQRLQLW